MSLDQRTGQVAKAIMQSFEQQPPGWLDEADQLLIIAHIRGASLQLDVQPRRKFIYEKRDLQTEA